MFSNSVLKLFFSVRPDNWLKNCYYIQIQHFKALLSSSSNTNTNTNTCKSQRPALTVVPVFESLQMCSTILSPPPHEAEQRERTSWGEGGWRGGGVGGGWWWTLGLADKVSSVPLSRFFHQDSIIKIQAQMIHNETWSFSAPSHKCDRQWLAQRSIFTTDSTSTLESSQTAKTAL